MPAPKPNGEVAERLKATAEKPWSQAQEEQGKNLARSIDTNTWSLGDLALAVAPIGEVGVRSGALDVLDKFARAIDVEPATLREYRRVAGHYPPANRLASVSWTAHRDAAALPTKDSINVLMSANKRYKNVTVRKVKDEVAGFQRKSKNTKASQRRFERIRSEVARKESLRTRPTAQQEDHQSQQEEDHQHQPETDDVQDEREEVVHPSRSLGQVGRLESKWDHVLEDAADQFVPSESGNGEHLTKLLYPVAQFLADNADAFDPSVFMGRAVSRLVHRGADWRTTWFAAGGAYVAAIGPEEAA